MLKQNYCKDCRIKISLRAKRCLSCANLGKNNPHYRHGKRCQDNKYYCLDCGIEIGSYKAERCHPCSMKTEEAKQKMRINNSGEGNPSWKGGFSCEPYCQVWTDKEFKQDIRERDNNIAWDIGYWWKGVLSIHHIDYNKKNCHPSNLITVSAGMNASANYDREWHMGWFQILMNKREGST